MSIEPTKNAAPGVVTGRAAVAEAYQQHELAEDYIQSRYESDGFGRATHNHQVRLLSRIIADIKPKRLLEVAPGPARLTVHLPHVEYGCAVEQSPAMLKIAAERLKKFGRDEWHLQQGDAFDLPFQTAEFDAALTFKLIRHFDRADRLKLLENLRRAVKPKGYLIFDVANEVAYRWLHKKWGVGDSWIDDFWFTPESIRSEMSDAGFGPVQLHPVQPVIQAQYYCWSQLPRVSHTMARAFGRVLEYSQWGQPLEWIAVCRCA